MSWIARLRLETELAHWTSAGRRPGLWWRDDDARAMTPALERLLRVRQDMPIALAVIPDGDLENLARSLAAHSGVTLGQHGTDHVNARAAGVAAGEYAPGAKPDQMAVRIDAGRAALITHGLLPDFYTPPWNRVDEALPGVLVDLGFDLLSAWPSEAGAHAGLSRRDPEIDLLRWRPTARFRGASRILSALRQALESRRREGSEAPVGLLTHHLDHDPAAWRFLEWFVPYSRSRFDWPAIAADDHSHGGNLRAA
jgi:hypothetical protein